MESASFEEHSETDILELDLSGPPFLPEKLLCLEDEGIFPGDPGSSLYLPLGSIQENKNVAILSIDRLLFGKREPVALRAPETQYAAQTSCCGFKDLGSPREASRAKLEELDAKAKYPELSQAAWYADTTKNAFAQLKLHGVPVVLGIKQQTVEWSLNGVLPDTNTSRSIVNTWIQQ